MAGGGAFIDLHSIMLLENSKTKSEFKWTVNSRAMKSFRHIRVTGTGMRVEMEMRTPVFKIKYIKTKTKSKS